METALRIVLFLTGCLIIVGIIWDYRRRSLRSARRLHASRPVQSKAPASTQTSRVLSSPKPPEQQSVIVLHLLAKTPAVFSGMVLLEAFKQSHLFYGARQIFHGYQYPKAEGSRKGAQLFSVVSMVEPGFFNLRTMHTLETPGISFFMILDDQMHFAAFESMLKVARDLALFLEADLRDSDLQPLSAAAIQACRERVAEHVLAMSAPDLAMAP